MSGRRGDPGGRAAAQRLWELIRVGRVDVIRLDMDRLPESLRLEALRKPDGVVIVDDTAEAAARAGFTPRLPRSEVVAGHPHLSVMGPLTLGVTIRAADLRSALADTHVSDLTVPATWNGAQISMQIGSVVFAEYPDMQLMQALPFPIVVSDGFDFAAFAETLLRIAGLGPEEARSFATQMATMPVLWFPIEPDDIVVARHVDLHTGRGTLLHDVNEEGTTVRVTLFWSVSDRLYVLSANASDDDMVAVANSIQ